MGTNDGFRNFSANWDLEKSMSTQTDALASAGGKPRWPFKSSRGRAAGARTGSIPPKNPLSFGPPSAPPYTHTQEEERKLGKSVSIVHPSGCGRDHKMAVSRRAGAGAGRAAGARCAARTGESAPRTAAAAESDPRRPCRPGELIFGERAEEIGDLGESWGWLLL